MDQLQELLASKFSLTEGETALLAADPPHAANPNAVQDLELIGRVVTDKDLSINFIRANALRLLHPVRGASIKSIGTNSFVIKFNHPLDRKKALGGCPWVLDKHALLLEPIDPNKEHADQKLTHMPIIARVSNLSLANRSLHVAQLIGDRLGEFVEIPKTGENHYSPFLRIKVRVDVEQPLKRGLNFKGVDGKQQWLTVAYEKLPLFCFLCGILGHGEGNCPLRYEEGFEEVEGEFSYGSWMRAIGDGRDSMGGEPGKAGYYQGWGFESFDSIAWAKRCGNFYCSYKESQHPSLWWKW